NTTKPITRMVTIFFTLTCSPQALRGPVSHDQGPFTTTSHSRSEPQVEAMFTGPEGPTVGGALPEHRSPVRSWPPTRAPARTIQPADTGRIRSDGLSTGKSAVTP
ncbi:MAG: hypothetical protein QOD87_683, partial [Pseudonocardiales bacterium]|nr:hypothetical protein [Pseudonocardiales bacterium]